MGEKIVPVILIETGLRKYETKTALSGPDKNKLETVMSRCGFGMGFFRDPNSQILNPGDLGFFSLAELRWPNLKNPLYPGL